MPWLVHSLCPKCCKSNARPPEGQRTNEQCHRSSEALFVRSQHNFVNSPHAGTQVAPTQRERATKAVARPGVWDQLPRNRPGIREIEEVQQGSGCCSRVSAASPVWASIRWQNASSHLSKGGVPRC